MPIVHGKNARLPPFYVKIQLPVFPLTQSIIRKQLKIQAIFAGKLYTSYSFMRHLQCLDILYSYY